jgi:hypothetical protein
MLDIAKLLMVADDHYLTTKYEVKIVSVKVKLKESCNRPGVAQRVPGDLGSQISMTFGT